MQVPAGAAPVGGAGRLARRRRHLLPILLAAAVIAADQATKAWAVRALADGPTEVVGSAVQFRLARNTGGAFSVFEGAAPILAMVAIVLVLLIVRMGRRETDRWILAGLGLVLGGAIGNLTDRVFRGDDFLSGGVVDFIDVASYPTFNVADSAITIGAVVLLIRAWRQ